ncbi:MAG: FKBP-type peptidyl-prolyl cis-trans isomerase [Nitrososphaerales archaeon]|jgi:peptidylprolyl isomerase
MTLEKGTLIFANYTAKVKDTGEGIETTLEEEAKKLKIHDATRKYEPRLVAVGEGWLISGLDEEVKKMEVGQRKEVELSPEKAFGPRDPTQTRMVPLRKFGEKARELEVGDSVDIDNRTGIVRFIGSGRAQVDFNHRLAGKSIVYDFEVVKKVETDDDKVRALIDRRFGGEGSKVGFKLGERGLELSVPEELFLLEGLQIIKRGISNDVFKFVPTVAELTFVEKFVNEKPVEKKREVPEKEPKTHAGPAPKPGPRPRRKKVATPAQTV